MTAVESASAPAHGPCGPFAAHSTLEVLRGPWPFSQVHPLDVEDVVRAAEDRRLRLRDGGVVTTFVLEELHQRSLLVPLYRVAPVGAPTEVMEIPSLAADNPVTSSTSGALLDGARLGRVTDPAEEDFTAWGEGADTYLYSPHQLLALSPALDALEAERRNDALPAHADQRRTEYQRAAMAGWRTLAVGLSMIETVYWPMATHMVSGSVPLWRTVREEFNVEGQHARLGADLDQLRLWVTRLRMTAQDLDTLGDFYDLVRRADPRHWSSLRGGALAAMDHRMAADMLEQFADDLAPRPPRPTASRLEPVYHHALSVERDSLDNVLTGLGLSPHPSLVLGVEGKTELLLVPRVMDLLGISATAQRIRVQSFDGVGNDLSILAHYAAGPLLGLDHGTHVRVDRPATRVLVLVDAEGNYTTRADRSAQRQRLMTAITQDLPDDLKPDLMHRDARLVEIFTWGKYPFEFAHFSDSCLADAMLALAGVPHPRGRSGLIEAINKQRTLDPTPDIEEAWKRSGIRKVQLAEQLWPRLERRVRRAIAEGTQGPPIMRAVVRAYQLSLLSPRANMALRRHPRPRG